VYGEFTNTGLTDLAFIAIGSGVGMGMVLDGKLRRGPMFTAGEIGLIPYNDGNTPPQIRGIEEIIGLDALKRRFGYDRRFGVDSMQPEVRDKMIDAVTDATAHIIAIATAMMNIPAFVIGGLTADSLGKVLIDEINRKVKHISPFSTDVYEQSLSFPALTGAARHVMDKELWALLSMDSAHAGAEQKEVNYA
jgi:predicted NBD/HSP70 family sugar kinase